MIGFGHTETCSTYSVRFLTKRGKEYIFNLLIVVLVYLSDSLMPFIVLCQLWESVRHTGPQAYLHIY